MLKKWLTVKRWHNEAIASYSPEIFCCSSGVTMGGELPDKYSARRCRAFWLVEKDFHDADSLYEYVKFGVFIRGSLEVDGPYTVFGHQSIEQFGDRDRYTVDLRLEEFADREEYLKHKIRIEKYAKAQLLTTIFVIFEYFLKNICLDLVSLESKPNGKLADELFLAWSADHRKEFNGLATVAGLQQDRDAWMRTTHSWKSQRCRVKDLLGYFDLTKADVYGQHPVFRNGKYELRKYGWDDFVKAREARHGVAHMSARSSMFSQHLSRGEIEVDDHLLAARSWILGFARALDDGIHIKPIVEDRRAGKPIDYGQVRTDEPACPEFSSGQGKNEPNGR